ncbi:MAG TPA: G8 domain-containing protein, partial [Candidatus Binataceae bacterium]|nr:G8 domain-containing protein [Candidatus Binataceae bacterium]
MIGFSISPPHHRQLLASILVALLAILTVLPGAATQALAQDICAGNLTPLSSCVRLPPNNDVVIGPTGCNAVYVDKSATLGKITIQSKSALCIRDSDVGGSNLVLTTTGIIDQGTFAIGSKATPIGTGSINGTVTVNFTGSRDVGAGGPAETCPDPNFRKGIEVCGGATLRLYGVKGVPLGGALRTDGT